MHLHGSLCCSTWIRRPFPPLPLARLYAACARHHGEGTPKAARLRARRPHPGQGTGCAGLWQWSWGAWRYCRTLAPTSLPCKVGCWGRQHAGRDAGRAGSTQWSSFACTVCGQGLIHPSCEPSLHPHARDQTCLRTGLPQPSMGRVHLSRARWLFSSLPSVVAPSREPCRLSWQSQRPRMLGSGCISHRRETDGFGTWGHLHWDCPVPRVPAREGRWSPGTGGDIPPGLMLEREGPGSGHRPCVLSSTLFLA